MSISINASSGNTLTATVNNNDSVSFSETNFSVSVNLISVSSTILTESASTTVQLNKTTSITTS
tara:strand:- start:2679 stop:2870 length:192 start_codon:yes stop_codon:yes gene_type:complete